jgi:hypothetical protein
MRYSNRIIARMTRITGGLLVAILAACIPATAQLSPAEPDPLARIRDAAKTNVQVCSATGETLCEQVAPKIIENALGESPLSENLRRLTDDIGGRVSGSPEAARAVAWGVAAFRQAGVDVHTEKYTIPATWSEGNTHLEVLSPAPFAVHLVSVAWAAGTPDKGLEAPIVFAGQGTEADFARIGSSPKGANRCVRGTISFRNT